MKNLCVILLVCLAMAACKKSDKKPVCGCDSEPEGTWVAKNGLIAPGETTISAQYAKYSMEMPVFVPQNLSICNPEALDTLHFYDFRKYTEVSFNADYHKSCKPWTAGQPEEYDITIKTVRVVPPKEY